MIPGTWLTEAHNTGGNPIEGVLPVEYLGVYSEGGNGTIIGTTELPFSEIALLFEESFIREHFGYGNTPELPGTYQRVLVIEMVQARVFGVLLLDSFTPPAVAAEFFEFPAEIQAACVEGIEGSVPIYGPPKTGDEVLFDDETASVPVFDEEGIP